MKTASNGYVVKSFAQGVFLMALGHRPIAISGTPSAPIFVFPPEAHSAGVTFVTSKHELAALVAAELT